MGNHVRSLWQGLFQPYSNVVIRRGDRVRLVTPGGGGYGDPKARAPEAVAEDVNEGYVSADTARRYYDYQGA